MTDDRAPAEEQALVASALAGDDGALGRLLSMHQRSAYTVAYRLLGNEADARDAVQEAFLLAVRAVRGQGAPPRDLARFAPWLRRVAANAALAELRRRPSFRPGPADEIAAPLPTGDYGDPARAAERREARGDVLRALLALPDRQRAALTLREYEGLSYDAIAALLGVSRGAVERLLFRARRGFRDAYEGLMATPAGWNPVAAAIPRAASAATEAARSAAAGSPAGPGPATGSGGAFGAGAAGQAAASGPPATPQPAATSLLTKLTGAMGAKAAAVLVAVGVAAGATATQLVPPSTAPAASPTAAAVTDCLGAPCGPRPK